MNLLFYFLPSKGSEAKLLTQNSLVRHTMELAEAIPHGILKCFIYGLCCKVPEEVVEEIKSSQKPLAIVEAVRKSPTTLLEVEAQVAQAFFGKRFLNMFEENKKKKKVKSGGYNILTGSRDVQNCNGWSLTVTSEQLRSLRGSNIGIFMVNLTKVS